MPFYLTKENDGYVMFNGKDEKHHFKGLIGISYNYWIDENGEPRGFIYKYGEANQVISLHLEMVNRFEASKVVSENDQTMKKTIQGIIDASFYTEGHFDLDELNKCLDISDYIIKIHQNHTFISIPFLTDQLKKEPSQNDIYTWCKALREKGVKSKDIIESLGMALRTMPLSKNTKDNIEEIISNL